MEEKTRSRKDKHKWTFIPYSKRNKALALNSSHLPTKTCTIAKGDSGASNHYFALRDVDVLDNIKPSNGTNVILPNSKHITSILSGSIPFTTTLSSAATETEVFPHLNHNLISLGQLCDDGCTITLDKHNLTATKNDKLIMKGTRSVSGDGLWDIPIPTQVPTSTPTHLPSPNDKSINVIIRKDKTKVDLIQYLHAACFSPAPDTFIKAIKNNQFTTWPGLTANLVKKHLPPCVFTAKGHLKLEQQGLQSTKNIIEKPPLPDPAPHLKTNDVIYALIDTKDKTFMDLTGRFPHCSSRGNEYIMIAYHYDSNAIIGKAIKNRQAATITAAWKQLNDVFNTAGLSTNTWILDNETSSVLQNAMNKHDTAFQLVPPHNHRANSAERAIQTFKNHFITGLCSLDPNFPIAEWDRLLDQCFLTLNLLRQSRLNNKLSAYAHVFGQFDFSATPLAPPGTKVVIHNKTSTRASWDPRGIEGWYIGPSLHHYRCVKCFLPQTRSEVNTDTVIFIPAQINFPELKLDDFLKQSAQDIITLLTNPPPSTVPSLQAGDSTRNALLQLATLLHTNPLNDTTFTKLNQQTQIIATKYNTKKPDPPEAPQINNLLPTTSSSTLTQALAGLARVLKQKKTLHTTPKHIPSHPPNKSFKHRAANALLATHLFGPIITHKLNHVYDANGKRLSLDALLNGDQKEIWIQANSNEIGRLAQGNVHGVKSTDTMDFIFKHEVPAHKKITYANFVCDIRHLKDEPYRVRLVVGGDKLPYDDDAGSPAASILETKLLINSVISGAKQGARFLSMDLKDFFLASPMPEPEFMKIHRRYIPEDIIIKYNLEQKFDNNYIYVRIKKGMYGLKQAAILAYEHLVKNLKPHGYTPIPHTVGLWKHTSRPITFCLCVDDFGIKYYNKDDVDHLFSCLNPHYQLKADWTGQNFCGLSFDWHYDKNYVDVSMPNYVKKVLHKFQHTPPKSPVYSPFLAYPWKPQKQGERQYAPSQDTSPSLNPTRTTRIQSIVGSVLYYARAIDYTLLPALNTISAHQSKPTEKTEKHCRRILDYLSTYPNVYVRYHASDMQLAIESDAAYLVEPQARSRIAGFYHLNSGQPHSNDINGAFHIECKTLRHVVASSAEAETAGVFHNAQIAVPIRHMLHHLGHKQHPTVIKTDNSTTYNFIHDNINQKKSKSWDMRYYWLRDRKQQGQFLFHWEKGENNKADYFTKHHTEKHHKGIRSTYVHDRYPTVNNLCHMSCKGVLESGVIAQLTMTSHPLRMTDDVVITTEYESTRDLYT